MKILISLLLVVSLYADTLSDYGYDSELGANRIESPKLTIDDIAFIYTGKITRWEDGTPIKLYIKSGNHFCQRNLIVSLLGISMARLREGVNKYGHIEYLTRADMVDKLANNVGSIGVMDTDEIYMSTDRGIVIVEVVE